MIDEVSALVELHLRFHTYKMGWSDKAVRRYVRDAGPLLDRLNELTRCDCTTRNARKAATLAQRMDELEVRIAELREREDLNRLRPALDGVAVMALLDVKPSPVVGRALEFLMEIRLDEGEITPQEAAVRLREWCPSSPIRRVRQSFATLFRLGHSIRVNRGSAESDGVLCDHAEEITHTAVRGGHHARRRTRDAVQAGRCGVHAVGDDGVATV